MKDWRSALAGLVVMVMLLAPAMARADSLDATSTGKFLSAETRLARTVIALGDQLEASADTFIDHVESACPGALPASLLGGSKAQQRTWTVLVAEAGAELEVAELSPVYPAVRRELARIAPLRWTSAALNRRVAEYVSRGRGALSLHPPDICWQAQAAARSDFRVVPPRTRAFNARYGSTDADSSALALARQMKPLATPGELAGVKRLGHLQTRIDRLLAGFGLQVFDRLMQALTGISLPGA